MPGTPDRRSPAPDADPPGWQSLSTRILKGLVHDLRGRAMALDSLHRLLGDDDEPAPGMEGEMQGQITRLKEVVELASVLADESDGTEEPLAPSDALGQVLDLWRSGVRGPGKSRLVDEGTAPPILVDWVLFRRVVLSCMARVEAEAEAEGSERGGIVVTLSGDAESTAEIELRWDPEDGSDAEGSGAGGGQEKGTGEGESGVASGGDRLSALADAVGRMSGALSWRREPGEGLVLKLRLPSLAARRTG